MLFWVGSGRAPGHCMHSLCSACSVAGILYALPEGERALQGSIQDLCVKWWERGLPAKENMGKTAFVMLLRRSLRTKTVRSLSKVHAVLCGEVHMFIPVRS